MSRRIGFANQLRGVAALCVVFSHLVGVYWLVPEVVTAVTMSPAPPGAVGPAGPIAVVSYPWFNFGPFGVAVFFLISGMVIPFSFERHGRWSFVLARLLRIYPTYLVGLGLGLGVTFAASVLWERPFTVTGRAVLSNALLVYDLVGEPSLDLVNWTLSVELKFYALAALLMPALAAGRVLAVLGAGLALLGVNACMAAGWVGDLRLPPSSVSYTVSSHGLCLGFMLIGVLFNFHHRGRLSLPGLLGGVALLLGCFVAGWRCSVWAPQFPVVSNNYLFAVALFAALYAVRNRLPGSRVLDGLAAISFPLYLVHSLLGYSMLRALMSGAGLGYGTALPLTLLGLGAVCWALHVGVERPFIRLGRLVGRQAAAGGDVRQLT